MLVLIYNNYLTDLEKKIGKLQNKIKAEKQFNRKVDLNKELNDLIKEMEELNHG